MPLTEYHIAGDRVRVGIWRITEPEAYFMRKLPLSDREAEELSALKGARRLEWLASRLLVQLMTGWAFKLVKDDFGKPHLSDSQYQVSVSHSRDYSVVIIAPCLVGIDIQYLTSKMERVAWRVFNEEKRNLIKPETKLVHLHVYWGAKEALYKAYGRRELDFKQHLLLEPFEYKNTEGVFLGRIEKDSFRQYFNIFYKAFDDYVLVYAVERHEKKLAAGRQH